MSNNKSGPAAVLKKPRRYVFSIEEDDYKWLKATAATERKHMSEVLREVIKGARNYSKTLKD